MSVPPERRSLKYIRLAAFLADQPPDIDRVELTLENIEQLLDETLPRNARFPSWWRNDDRRMHSKAWLAAGWIATEVEPQQNKVVFTRVP